MVGVCAPSGPVDAGRLTRGVAELKTLGFDVRVPDGILDQTGFTAGSVERRLGELRSLFADDEVAGVLSARGGAGAGWLLAGLDPRLFRAHPKIFVGYSDLTYLHLFLDRLGIVSVHGPMVARELADGSYDRQSLLHALTGSGAPYSDDDLVPVRAGQARGTLRGGCLSILASAEGTPWALPRDPEGTILFLEDVDEAPYRIDRMLLQLRDAGALTGVRGIVFGDMKGCSPPMAASFSLVDVIREALEGFDVPIALGLSSGHASGAHVSLPFGVPARIEVGESAAFEVLDTAVT